MLPELILREERSGNLPLLFFFGLLSGAAGIALASMVFPGQSDIVSVFLAALPLVYPLTREFFEDEKETFENGSAFRTYIDEVGMYFALFAGVVVAFFVAGVQNPDMFAVQYGIFEGQLSAMGIGASTAQASFTPILLNNLMVYGIILGLSSLVGSSGSFILVWNGSVLGTFLGALTRALPASSVATGTPKVPSPLFYLPHASLEMGGFIVAGISGTLVSAAVYRKHFDSGTWKHLGSLVGAGVLLIFVAAFVETA